MSRFIEVTVVEKNDDRIDCNGTVNKNESEFWEWKEVFNTAIIETLWWDKTEAPWVGCIITIIGEPKRKIKLKESYEQIRGVLMGKGQLPAFYGLCPKCGLVHDMDRVCDG